MIIQTAGVEFEPLSWDFTDEAMYGKISFLVMKGVFEREGNNGAYCLESKNHSLCDEVDVAMHYLPICDEDVPNMSLLKIFETASEYICDNLNKVSN